MTDTMRWRYGDTNPVVSKPVAAGIGIEIGDLVSQDDNGDVWPASALSWKGPLTSAQEAFHASFLGVAMQRSLPRDNGTIRVSTTGIFEFCCAPSTFELGDLVAPARDDVDLLLNQAVALLGRGYEHVAIGRVAGRVNPAGTIVLVSIVSTRLHGGVQRAALPISSP